MPGVLIKYSHAPVAQRTEQRSSKPKVVGSNPAGGAWMGVLKFFYDMQIKSMQCDFPHLMGSDDCVW